MATNFPEDLDNLSNPEPTDSLAGHAELHDNVNDAIEAIQIKIGKDGSQDENSIDYKIRDLSSQISGISGSTNAVQNLIGLEGNNDLVVTQIENKTTIDSFSKSEFGSASYKIKITQDNNVYTSNLSLMIDDESINVSESDVITNFSGEIANITFEENSGIISLCVAPATSAVTVRYFRTALKA